MGRIRVWVELGVRMGFPDCVLNFEEGEMQKAVEVGEGERGKVVSSGVRSEKCRLSKGRQNLVIDIIKKVGERRLCGICLNRGGGMPEERGYSCCGYRSKS